jgi:hypothetical protein
MLWQARATDVAPAAAAACNASLDPATAGPPAQCCRGNMPMSPPPTPAPRSPSYRGGSKPHSRQRLAQCRFMGCRQLKPCHPAGQVQRPVRALHVPTCSWDHVRMVMRRQ